MTELKKCRFCGGEADVSQDDDGMYIVGCDRDYDCENNIFMAEQTFESEDDAILWWNNRN
jgi:hypothetical protein